jgi:hypothetical protein
MADSLFEIRATLERNHNREITKQPWRRVIRVPGNNPHNAVPFYAAHAVLNHCHDFSSTNLSPKDGGVQWTPLKVEVLIFTPSTVNRNGYVNGNTGASPIWAWEKNPSLPLREWGNGFRDYADDADRKINSLPLPSELQEQPA